MPKIYYCEICDFTCSKNSNYQSHLLTAKHKNREKFQNKMPQNYYCECCDYTTSSKKDYNKHLLTAKHENMKNSPIKKCHIVRSEQIM